LAFSITLFTNIVARNSFESLGYAVLIMFILSAAGVGAIAEMLEIIVPEVVLKQFANYSIINSFYNISSGFMSMGDLVLYLSFTVMFLVFSCMFCVKNSVKIKYKWGKIFVTLILTFLINALFLNSTIRFDLTTDKIYSISDNIFKITDQVGAQGVQITFYYSRSNTNIPVEMSRYAEYVDKYLKQLSNKSKGKVHYKLIDPELSKENEVLALQDQMAEIPTAGGDHYYAGISVRKHNHSSPMPYIAINRRAFLEYDLAEILSNYINQRKKHIGILTDLDLGKDEQRPHFMKDLIKRYKVDIIPFGYPSFPQYDLVIVFMSPFMDA
jgi:ABC-type uncharacterized transport system involved in gliding motility auxiliary subunit